jgi:hypothetical protein
LKASQWIGGNPVPALTLGGLVLFALLRESAGVYYSSVGFTPEEIGLGYAQLIALAVYQISLVASVWCPRVLRLATRARLVSSEIGSRRSDVVILSVAAVVILLPLLLGRNAGESRLSQGEPSGSIAFPGYSWPSQAAIIHPLTETASVPPDQCVIYLGQADGFAAL